MEQGTLPCEGLAGVSDLGQMESQAAGAAHALRAGPYQGPERTWLSRAQAGRAWSLHLPA